MKKYLVFIFGVILITSGILLGLYYAGIILKGVGALQINTNIKSKVYLDDKYIGDAPLCKCAGEDKIKTGSYSLKIVPHDKNLSPFSQRIKVEKDILTYVERTFLPGSFASAYILTLEKNNSKEPEIFVTSIPDGSLLSIDNSPQGVTPLLIKKVSGTQHQIELSKNGFAKKTIIVKPVAFHKLVANVILGIKSEGKENEIPVLPSGTPSKTATDSAAILKKTLIKIKSTPVNFLRVRAKPSISADEITKVKPGETYPLISEEEGWFQIRLTGGETGWVSSEYSERINQ